MNVLAYQIWGFESMEKFNQLKFTKVLFWAIGFALNFVIHSPINIMN